MGNVPPKKVINVDAGDADHVGGNDWDDVVDYLNDQDKVGPVKINTETWVRDDKFKFRDSGNDHLYTHSFGNLAANRTINWPVLTADDEPLFKTFAATVTGKTFDIKDNIFAHRTFNSIVFKVGSTYYAVKYDGTLISSGTVFETVFNAALALKGTIFLSDSERTGNFTLYNCTSGTEFTIPDKTSIIGPESCTVSIGVPDGYTGILFKMSGNTGYVQFKNLNVYEQGTQDRNWTAFKWTVGSAQSASLNVPMENIQIFDASIGVELETTHSTSYLNSMIFKDIIFYGTRQCVVFDQQAGDIDENVFQNVNVQSTVGVTTYGFKDINGTGNQFMNCIVWDPDDAAIEANIKSTADGTTIIGGRMTGGKGHFIDQGTKTLILDSGNIVTSKLFTTPDLAKMGTWYGATAAAGDGILNGILTNVTVGTGSGSTTTDSTGIYRTYSTGATNNSIYGQYANPVFTRRIINPYFKAALYLNSVSTVRVFAGLVASASAPASTSDPLNALEGIGLWLDTAVSANWKIMHNDSSGASTVDDTTKVAAVSTLYPIEVYAVADTKFRWVFDGVSTDVSSNIPASTTNLGFRVYIENTTGSDRTMRHYYTIVKTDK